MTVKTIDLGGADWADGDILYAADLNDTFGAATIHRKRHTYATETTTQSTSDISATSFTITTANGGMLLSCWVKADIKISNNVANIDTYFKISGTNLGSYYLTERYAQIDVGAAPDIYDFSLSSSKDTMFITGDITYLTVEGGTAYRPLPLKDGTTTFDVRFLCNNALHTAYIQNIEVEICYVERAKDD